MPHWLGPTAIIVIAVIAALVILWEITNNPGHHVRKRGDNGKKKRK